MTYRIMLNTNGSRRFISENCPAIQPKGDVKIKTTAFSIAIILARSLAFPVTTIIFSNNVVVIGILQASTIVTTISHT